MGELHDQTGEDNDKNPRKVSSPLANGNFTISSNLYVPNDMLAGTRDWRNFRAIYFYYSDFTRSQVIPGKTARPYVDRTTYPVTVLYLTIRYIRPFLGRS